MTAHININDGMQMLLVISPFSTVIKQLSLINNKVSCIFYCLDNHYGLTHKDTATRPVFFYCRLIYFWYRSYAITSSRKFNVESFIYRTCDLSRFNTTRKHFWIKLASQRAKHLCFFTLGTKTWWHFACFKEYICV